MCFPFEKTVSLLVRGQSPSTKLKKKIFVLSRILFFVELETGVILIWLPLLLVVPTVLLIFRALHDETNFRKDEG